MADFSINADIKANASEFVSELKKGEVSVGNFGNIAEKVLGKKGKLVMALAAATAAAVKFGQAMNASMSEIAKGTGKTGEELHKLRENVHDSLVSGVGRSAKEVGTMIADLNTRYGVTGKEVVRLTSLFDDFSDVTGTDTKTAINLTADAMKKWNIDIADTDKLLDQLTVASQESGAGVDELLQGLKSGQAVFSQFGMSATDTIAFMSALKSNGIETSQALVGMRTALAKFAQEGVNAQQGFAEVSEAIRNAKTQTEALNIATEYFGTRNGAEMVKVLQSGASSAEDFKNKIMEAGGAVARTNEAARTSKDAIEDLIATLSGTFGGLAEGLDQLFKGVIDSVSSVMRTLDPILRPIMNTIRDLLGFVGELTSELGKFIGDSAGSSLGFNSLAQSLQSTYEMIHNILGNVLESFKAAFGFIFAIMNGQFELAWLNLKKIFVVYAKSVLDLLSDLLNGFKDQINVFIDKVINPFVEKINWVQEKLGKTKTQKFDLIENFDLSKVTGITDSLNTINNKINELSGKSVPKLTGELGQVEESVAGTNKELKETNNTGTKVAKTFKKGFIETLIRGFENCKTASDEFGVTMQNMGELTANTLKSSFGSMFTELGESLVNQEASWNNMSAVALEGIGQVLIGLGSELVSLAAVRAAHYDFASAAKAAAAAAAAFAAGGAVTAIASSMKTASKAVESATESLAKFNETLKDIQSAGSIADYVSGYTQLIALQDDLTEKTSAYSDELISLTEARRLFAKGVTASTYTGDDEVIIEALQKAEKIYKKLYNTYSDMSIASRPEDMAMRLTLSQMTTISTSEQKQLYEWQQELKAVQEEINAYSQTVIANFEEQREALQETIDMYKLMYSVIDAGSVDTSVVYHQLLTNFKQVEQEIITAIADMGTNIGDTLMDNIVDGASKNDFLVSLKNIVRTNILKLAVYTEEMQEALAEAGSQLISAISLGDTDVLKQARTSFEALWDNAKRQALQAESFLEEVFGDIVEDIEDVTETVADIGGDIADALVDNIADGLTQSDFLESMKTYIKKMVVTSVVYTEAMQSEIAAIGEAISKGITDGFSEVGLQEIKRDLSYVFYTANNAVSSVDSLLSNVFSGYATGTNNATAGLHLVGEAGPELVRFRGGEQVYNARETASILNSGVGGNNFNVTFNNMQDTTAYAMMSQLQAYNRQLAINGVL